MDKDEVVQTRVSKKIKGELKDRAEDKDTTVAEEIRTILGGVFGTDDDTDTAARDNLLHDLATINTTTAEQDSLATILETHWGQLLNVRTTIRPTIRNTDGTVYIAGQGTSYAIGDWLAARLQERSLDVVTHPAEDVPLSALDTDDTLILITRSGDTQSITALADRAQATGATLVAVSTKKFLPFDTSDAETEELYWLELPDAQDFEQTEVYTTRHAFFTMAVLYAVVLADDPSLDAVQNVFGYVDEVIHNQLAPLSELEDDEAAAVKRRMSVIELDGDDYYLNDDSPFVQAVDALDDDNSLAADPILAGLGPFNALGWFGVQSHSEFLLTTAAHIDIGSIQNRLFNVLYHGEAYLVATLPLEETDRYDRALNYLFSGQTSVASLLRYPRESRSFRVLAFTFNDLESRIENELQLVGLYGEDGLIPLPDPEAVIDGLDPEEDDELAAFGRDLLLAAAHYFLVYAILERRWEQDHRLREEVTRGPLEMVARPRR